MSPHEQHIALLDRAAEYNDVEGLRILAPSGVYHPHERSSTYFMMSVLPDVTGLDVLEIGGGSGALSLVIRKRGAAKVVATDVSDRACATMECNALLNGLSIDVRYGDMFDPLLDRERFDLVIFNIPLMDKPISHPTELALCDPDGELLGRFLHGLPAVVKPEGQALFMHASISAPMPLGVSGRIGMVAESQRDSGDIFRILSWRP